MGDDQDIFEASTGVKLRIKTPSAMIMQRGFGGILGEEPKPPVVHNETKGRDEPNPNDPDYLEELQRWRLDTGARGLRALIPTGTELVSKPDDMEGPEDPGYADLMTAMGVEPAPGKHTRYVQWVTLVACSLEDLNQMGMLLLRRVGVPEEDVASAIATFRGPEGRDADNGGSPQ